LIIVLQYYDNALKGQGKRMWAKDVNLKCISVYHYKERRKQLIERMYIYITLYVASLLTKTELSLSFVIKQKKTKNPYLVVTF
jgi:hypothetical protein